MHGRLTCLTEEYGAIAKLHGKNMETSSETILKTKNSDQETLESIIVHNNHVFTKDGKS